MSISRLDKAFRALVNRETTDVDKFDFNELGADTINVHADDIWSETIAQNDPAQAVVDGVAEVRTLFVMTEDTSVPGSQSYKANSTPGNPASNRLRDWISPKFGTAYTIRVFDNSNNEIYPTSPLGWFFDYQTGILTFDGDVGGIPKPFKVTGWRYVGDKGAAAGLGVLREGTLIGLAPNLDFHAGANVTISVTFDALNKKNIVTIAATGGGGGGPADGTQLALGDTGSFGSGLITLTSADSVTQNIDDLNVAILTALAVKQSTSQKGSANGYPALDGSGLVPAGQLPAASTSIPGIVRLATNTDILSGRALQSDDSRLPTQGENDALVGTNGSPGTANKFVTNSDSRNSDSRTPTTHAASHASGGADELHGDQIEAGTASSINGMAAWGSSTNLFSILNSINRTIISVKAFGALGDGVTNDTTALQAAIDAVKATGGQLYIPRGTYMFSNLNMSHINASFDKSMTVRGDGPDASVLQQVAGATGNAIDLCGSNYVRFESFGVQVVGTAQTGVLCTRLDTAGNANFNQFIDFWVRGDALKGAFVGIGNECTTYDRCWFDASGTCAFFSGAYNNISATSAFGAIQNAVSNTANHAVNCRFTTTKTNGRTVWLSDGAGMDFSGCETYTTNGQTIQGHIYADAPQSNEFGWMVKFDRCHFEGDGNVFVFADSASPPANALYENWHITNCICINSGFKWTHVLGTHIAHTNFVFENNEGPFLVELQELEHAKIDHFEAGATITVAGNANGCVIRGADGGITLANSLCTSVEFMALFADLGKNYSVYGAVLGQAGRYIRYIPSTSAPANGQRTTGMIAVADPSGWDPASVGGSLPYPIFWDGSSWRPMTETFGTINALLAVANAPININGQNFTGVHQISMDGDLNSTSGTSTLNAFGAIKSNGTQAIALQDTASGGGVSLGWQGRSQIKAPSFGAFDLRNWNDDGYATVGVATPTSAEHAAPKAYVDAAIAGLSWKTAVRLATTANISLVGTQPIDSITANVNDRVLVKNQTTGSENGIYVVGGGAWSRAADFDASAEAIDGSAVFIGEGTTLAGTQWVLTTNAPITIGTTALTFAQFSSGGGVSDGDKGDITVTSSGSVWTIDNDVITNVKLANMATATFKGRTTAGTGDPEDLSVTQATALLNAFTNTLKGLVPPPNNGSDATTYLRANGNWVALAFSEVNTALGAASATIGINNQDLTGVDELQAITLRVGNTTGPGVAYFKSLATDSTPTAFTSDDLVIGRSVTSGPTSGALFFRYNDTANESFIGSLSPSTSWNPLRIGASATFLQNAAGTPVAILPGTNTDNMAFKSTGKFLWTSGSSAAGAIDTGLERIAAGVAGATDGAGTLSQFRVGTPSNGSDATTKTYVDGRTSDADKGDIVTSSSFTVWTIDSGVVTNTKLANMATATFKGRTTAGTGDPEDLSVTQATAMLNVFSSSLKGLAPSSGGGTTNYLRADGTWAAPPGGGSVTFAAVNAALATASAPVDFNGQNLTGVGSLTIGGNLEVSAGGGAGVPSLFFTGSTTTGLRASGGSLFLVANGADVAQAVGTGTFLFYGAVSLGGGNAYLQSSGSGIIKLSDVADTSFDRLQLGGSTSSFPALKRSGAGLVARLADDSADTTLTVATPTSGGHAANKTYADTKEVPLTAGTGLTRTTNTLSVNTSQNITKLSNLTTNGFVKTGSSDGTLSIDTSTYLTANQTITLSGDVTGSGTVSITTTVANDAISNAKLANVATATFKGRTTAGTGDPEDLTVTQATALLNAFVGDSGSGGTKGLVPAPSTGDATKFLKGDGTWATVSGGVSDGDKGDITVSSSGTVWTIDNDVVTYGKMQNVSATDKLLGRATAGSGDVEEITCTAAGRALIDDADATAQRATLGLSTLVLDVQHFQAESLDIADSNWSNTTPATPIDSVGNPSVFTVSYSGSTLNAMGGKFRPPTSAVNCKFEWIYQADSAPGTTNNKVQWRLAFRALGSTGASTNFDFTVQTNANDTVLAIFSQTVSLATLGLTAGSIYQFQLVRVISGVTNNMTQGAQLSELITTWTT